MPLTDTAIRNAKPRETPYKISDGGGLFLLVKPTGARYWRMAYRWHGKQRTLAIGVYPTISLADARKVVQDAKRKLAAGIDPNQAKKAEQRAARLAAAATFEAVAREWHEYWKEGKNKKYAIQVMRRMEADLFPEIGARPIAEIDAAELLDVLRKVERRGVAETALRLRQLCGQVFRYAIVNGGRARLDPTPSLRGAIKVNGRKRHHSALPRAELPTFLHRLDHYHGQIQTKLALRLVVLTFVRTTELRAARKEEFEGLDGNEPLWRLPPERMKMHREHLVPLPRQAIPVIREAWELSGESDLLFPAPTKEGYMSNNTMLYALYRMGYHSRATVHGFRRVASTILNEAGFNSDWIERQLAHDEDDEVRAAYNAAEWLADRRRMLQWWADYLDDLRKA